MIPNPQPQQDLFYIPTPPPPILQPFDHNHDDNNTTDHNNLMNYNVNLVSVPPPVTLPLGSRSSYDPTWPSGCQPQQIDHHHQQQLYNLDPPMFPVMPKHCNVNPPAQEEEGDPIVSLSCLTPTRLPSNELEFIEAMIMSSLPLPPPPASSTSSKSSSSSPSSTLTPLSSCGQFVVNPNFTSSWGP